MPVVADANEVRRLIQTLADAIAEAMGGDEPWAIVGIRRRGDVLAQRLAQRLKPTYTGALDISLYRDDLSELGPQPIVRTTELDFDVDGARIVLVDDVLMSGRSVRAALQSLIDFGRPECIRLAVLVDRGGRELPICPDFVGRRIDAGLNQHVCVEFEPTDDADRIVVLNQPATTG